MRRRIAILLSVELLIAIFSSQAGFLHRRGFDRAFIAWRKSDTLETRLELEKESKTNEWYRWGIAAAEFGGMAVVTMIVVCALDRRKKGQGEME